MAMANKVVIVGAGFGGQGVCHRLLGNADITVIDANESISIGATWQYELNERAERITIPLARTIAARANRLLVNTSVTNLDAAARTLTLADGSTEQYDYLVLAPGAVSDPSAVPGLVDCALDVTSSQSSTTAAIKGQLESITEGSTVLIAITKCPYKCPPYPFELAFLVDEILRSRNIRDSCRIIVTCPVPWPFGGPAAQEVFLGKFAEKNIEYIPEACVEALCKGEDGKVTVSYASEMEPINADVVLATYPHRAPDFIRDAAMLNPKGSVPVDLQTNRVLKGVPEGETRVFCVGDACAAVLPAVGAPIPKAGEFAWHAGVAVADIIAAEIRDPTGAIPLPDTRQAQCIAEAGFGDGIIVNPDFSAAFVNPSEGKPKMTVTAVDGGGKAKVDWINKYLTLLCGDDAPSFQPSG